MGFFDKIKSAVGGSEEESTKPEGDNDNTAGAFSAPEGFFNDRVNVKKRTKIIHRHYDVSREQAHTIAQKIKEGMEKEDGGTTDLMRSDLEEKVDVDEELIHTIVWTEQASINTMRRVNNYLENGREDDLYKISTSVNERTHPVTREAYEETEHRGGVPMKELARILIEKAEKYEDEGGTPERMEHWVPHERFRFSIVRHVDY